MLMAPSLLSLAIAAYANACWQRAACLVSANSEAVKAELELRRAWSFEGVFYFRLMVPY